MKVRYLLGSTLNVESLPVLGTIEDLQAVLDREISSVTLEKSGEHDRLCFNLEAATGTPEEEAARPGEESNRAHHRRNAALQDRRQADLTHKPDC